MAQTTTTLMEYGTTSVAWTAAGLAEWTAGGTPTFDNNDNPTYVGITGGNGSYATSKTISPTNGTIINVTAVWRGRSNTGRAFSAGNGSYFRYGNIIVAQNDQDKKHGYGFAGLGNIGSVTTFTAGSYRVDISNCTWLLIEMEINTVTGIMTSFTIKSEDGNTTYVSQSNISLTDPDYTTIAFGYRKSGSVSYANAEQLKSIKITETTQTASYADYTVHFVDGDGIKVKDDVVRNGQVGSTVNANSDDQETFYSTDYKYVYNSDGGGVEVKSDGSSELTVTYTKIGKYTYTLNAVDGDNNILKELGSGEQFEGDDATIYFSKAIYVNNKWYITTYTGNWVFHEAKTENILFTEDATMSYFFEVEDINKSREWAATGSYPDRYSNGKVGRLFKGAYAYTDALEGGIYSVTLWGRNQAGSSDASIGLYVRDSEGNETKCGSQFENWAAGGGQGEKTVMVNIPDGYSLMLKNENADYNSNLEMDYLILRKSAINSMTIVGFTPDTSDADKWNPANGIAMTQSEDNPAVWTAVVNNYVISGTELTYYYKAVANGSYEGYQLPASGNQDYNFDYDGAREGKYMLTFTANTLNHTVELAIEKQVTGQVYFINTGDWDEANVNIWVWDANNSDYNYTGGTWPGVAMTKTSEQKDGHDVYTWSTYDITGTPTNLIISNNGSDTDRTGDQTFVNGATYKADGSSTVTKHISAAGYATFACSADLDFSTVTGLKAYNATITGDNVTFNEVTTTVAAGEGILLKGAEGDYEIPTTTGATQNVDNMLIGVLEETTITETGIFVLMNGTEGVGFYKTKKAFTLGANTAYLPVHVSSDPAREFIGFGGEDTTTSIEGIAPVQNDNKVYNLNGQRVVAPQKGLYIVNGKKVVLK